MRNLTKQEIATYAADGVVYVPQAVGPEWVSRMLDAVDRTMPSASGYGMQRYLYKRDPEFAAFTFETGLARLVGQATGSKQVRAYFDQVFVKGPASDDKATKEFTWHQDSSYWPVGGTDVVSTWVACTSCTAETSALEFVRGSHTWDKNYRPAFAVEVDRDTLNKVLWEGFGDHVYSLTDEIVPFQHHPDEYDVLSFSVEPGDALLFNYRTVHRSRENRGRERRVAVSWRWLGDDTHWAWSRGREPVIGPADTYLQPGDPITDDDAFPVVYSAA